jgi:hypothetical protein
VALSLAPRNSNSFCLGCNWRCSVMQVEAPSVEPPAAAAEVVSEEAPGGKGVR